MRVFADKIASVTRNLKLDRQLTLTRELRAEHGAVVAGRVLRDKSTYNQLEDCFGRMNIVHAGDVVVGALGHRNALHGYEGVRSPHSMMDPRIASYGEANHMWDGAEAAGFAKLYGVQQVIARKARADLDGGEGT